MSSLTELHERKKAEAWARDKRNQIAALRHAMTLCDPHQALKDSELYKLGVLPGITKAREDFVASVWSMDPKLFEMERARVAGLEHFAREIVRHAGRKAEYAAKIDQLTAAIESLERSGRIAREE